MSEKSMIDLQKAESADMGVTVRSVIAESAERFLLAHLEHMLLVKLKCQTRAGDLRLCIGRAVE